VSPKAANLGSPLCDSGILVKGLTEHNTLSVMESGRGELG
jgi:hypothetical protein